MGIRWRNLTQLVPFPQFGHVTAMIWKWVGGYPLYGNETHESDLNHSVHKKNMLHQIDPVREENKNHYSTLTQQIVTNYWQVGLLCDLLYPEIPVDQQKFVGEKP